MLISETPMLISRFNPLKGNLCAKGYWCGLALAPVYFFDSPYPLPPVACCGSAGGSCGVLLPSLVLSMFLLTRQRFSLFSCYVASFSCSVLA